MPHIRKTTIKLTILHPDVASPDGLSLEAIAYEINEGGWIGATEIIDSAAVTAKDLQAELLAIGNDGSFFDEYP